MALYQPWIYLKGGLEKSILELVRRSRHDWHIFTSHYEPENTFSAFRDLDVTELKRVSVKRDLLSVFLASLRIFATRLPLAGFDMLVVWCDGLGDMIVFQNRDLPTANICSTPLRPVFDPVYSAQAIKNRGPLSRTFFKVFQTSFRFIDRLAWNRYSGVIATSQEVKNRIQRGNLISQSTKMALFYPGIDWHSYEGETSYEPFLLVPGRIMWTKNIELAMEAFLAASMPDGWRLVIAGFLDQKSRDYYEKLQKISRYNEAKVEFVISPSEQEMRRLYKSCSAVLFPPLNEDWGIVPLEAMASSKPVLANASGGPCESIINGKTGWLLKPDVQSWAEILEKIPSTLNELKEMGRTARAHTRKYDWMNFVQGIDSTLEHWVVGRKNTLQHAKGH